MIPPFDEHGNLPPGVYTTTVDEIKRRFAHNTKRNELFKQIETVISMLKRSSCLEVYLNGSFITDKDEPEDYDLCWEPTDIKATADIRKLLQNPEILKEKFLGDIFPRLPQPPHMLDYVRFWQRDLEGNAKGIIRILLREGK